MVFHRLELWEDIGDAITPCTHSQDNDARIL